MPLRLDIGINREQLRRLDAQLGGLPAVLRQRIRVAIDQGLARAWLWMVKNRLSAAETGGPTLKGPGRLAEAINWTSWNRPREVGGTLGINPRSKAAIYGPVHEWGATIHARNVRYLTIPLTPEARRRPARRWGDLFVFRSKRGNLLLARHLGGDQIEPQFLLRESVTIPARPFFWPTIEKFLPQIADRIETVVNEALDEAPAPKPGVGWAA